MLNKRIRDKAIKDLNEVQKDATIRLLGIDDIKSKIEQHSKIIRDLSRLELDFEFEYRDCFYRGSYYHSGTCFKVTFNSKGAVNSIDIYRRKTDYAERINIDLSNHTELEKKLFREKFNISNKSTIILAK